MIECIRGSCICDDGGIKKKKLESGELGGGCAVSENIIPACVYVGKNERASGVRLGV